MSPHSFWNLAGRAGRWGREFAGNIFAIDVHDERQWPAGPPRKRQAVEVKNAGDNVLGKIEEFQEFAQSEDPGEASRGNRYFEQILGELVSAYFKDGTILRVGWLRGANEAQYGLLSSIVEGTAERIRDVPRSLIERNRSINPLLIGNFFRHLMSEDVSLAPEYMAMSPDLPNAFDVLKMNLRLCDRHLGSDFGTESQINLKTQITLQWIRGMSLSRIIGYRLDYLSSRRQSVSVPKEIRNVMKLINENARYLIPKYLACYADCIREWYKSIQREDLVSDISEVQDLLESGVGERTMLGLVGLGLSRTAAINLAAKIGRADMSMSEIVEWLTSRDLAAYDISPVIIREVQRLIERTPYV